MLFRNLNLKAIALITAVIVWIFVNQSITETKTIPNVPVKVTNLPPDKTIIGLLPNGYISQRITLTLSGSKDVIQQLEQGDLEVHIDASSPDTEDWFVQITKKNIVSLNPSLDLRHHLNQVTHPDFAVKLSNLITEKVPIFVKRPTGNPPEGYEFLDIWPERLMQTMSGPKEEIQKLKGKGLELTLDLSKVTKEMLDSLKHSKKNDHDDEISYAVPEKWKKVPIKFRDNNMQEINDPDAQNLRIDFLKKDLLPLGKEIPISVYYPIKYLDKINPTTDKLTETKNVHLRNGVALFSVPVYFKDVSRRFIDIIRDHLELVVIAAPKSEREFLQWSVEVIDTREMEDTYVAYVITEQKQSGLNISNPSQREEILRKRFKEYMQKLTLFTANGEKLNLVCSFDQGKITVLSE
jgi:hypothetical protein